MLRTLRDDDRGQGLAEYGLLLGFVAVLCIAAVVFFGSQLLALYQNVSTTYP
jgi:Flp pilus assembly pilin Flp